MCVNYVTLQAAGGHSVSGICGVIHLLFILLLAPHEWQFVIVAPSVITCFSVFLYFFCVSFCTSLSRKCSPLDVQLVRLYICFFCLSWTI